MTPQELFAPAALACGWLAGALYFHGLRAATRALCKRRGPAASLSRRQALASAASLGAGMLRLLLLAAALAWFARLGAWALLAGLGGLLLARHGALRRARRGD